MAVPPGIAAQSRAWQLRIEEEAEEVGVLQHEYAESVYSANHQVATGIARQRHLGYSVHDQSEGALAYCRATETSLFYRGLRRVREIQRAGQWVL
jgi:hypothetical protein